MTSARAQTSNTGTRNKCIKHQVTNPPEKRSIKETESINILQNFVQLDRQDQFCSEGLFFFSITPLCYECYFSLEAPAQSSLLDVSLVGIEFREGGFKWLSDNVLSAEVKMTPLQVTKESTLDCVVYKKKVLYQIRKQSTKNLRADWLNIVFL